MRTIKFRVWDPNSNSMYTNIGIDKIHLYDFKGDNITEQDGLEIMQYTGLTDRNGQEIYEGDVISDNLGKGKVEYRETRAGYRVTYGDRTAKWFVDYTIDEMKTIEVIGNIYEHPELLEG